MSITNIQTYNFGQLQDYLWAASDFQAFQSFIGQSIVFATQNGPSAALSGLFLTPTTGLVINVGAGLGIGSDGTLQPLLADVQVTGSAPASNSQSSLVVLRNSPSGVNYIPNPSNPLASTIPLNYSNIGTPIIFSGAAATSPSYPAVGTSATGLLATDIILGGFTLASGATGIPASGIDYSVRNVSLMGTPSSTRGMNPYCQNIGLTYASGVLTICGANQAALSISNPAYVWIPSAINSGETVRLKLTANVSITDVSGSGNLNGILWGTTNNIAWNQYKPFYLYAANLNDTDSGLSFFLSGIPNQETVTGSASYLGYKGTAPATSAHNNNIFLLSSSPSGYASVAVGTAAPAALIGGIAMTKNSGNQWTISLTGTGISKNISLAVNENLVFTMPSGQNTAVSGYYFYTSSGAPPSFSNSSITYTVKNNGLVNVNYGFSIATNGSSAADIEMPFPLVGNDSLTNFTSMGGIYSANAHSGATGGFHLLSESSGSSGTRNILFDLNFNALLAHDFSGSTNSIFGSYTYQL